MDINVLNIFFFSSPKDRQKVIVYPNDDLLLWVGVLMTRFGTSEGIVGF